MALGKCCYRCEGRKQHDVVFSGQLDMDVECPRPRNGLVTVSIFLRAIQRQSSPGRGMQFPVGGAVTCAEQSLRGASDPERGNPLRVLA